MGVLSSTPMGCSIQLLCGVEFNPYMGVLNTGESEMERQLKAKTIRLNILKV